MTLSTIAPTATPTATPTAAFPSATDPAPTATLPDAPTDHHGPPESGATIELIVANDGAVERGFGKAIIAGSILGIVVMSTLITAVVAMLWPSLGWAGAIGVGFWTGLWGGAFLGGTVTVGLWSSKHFD